MIADRNGPNRTLRVYGRAVLPHDDGAVCIGVARTLREGRTFNGAVAPPRRVFTLRAEGLSFALGAEVFTLCALRAAARDPRTDPRARRTLNRWRRTRRALGER